MFTGLVQAVGVVRSITSASAPGNAASAPSVTRLVVDPAPWRHRPALGDSIAVNGCCLTIAEFVPLVPHHPPTAANNKARAAGTSRNRAKSAWGFDVVQQTLAMTALGQINVGDRVNLEHALSPATLIGGHLVAGHVDGVGVVESIGAGADWRLRVLPRDPRFMRYVVPKGSITLDGVSLTIANVFTRRGRRGFEVALIPTTLRSTTLGELRPDALVNLEADMIAKTVVHYLSAYPAARIESPGARTRRKPRA